METWRSVSRHSSETVSGGMVVPSRRPETPLCRGLSFRRDTRVIETSGYIQGELQAWNRAGLRTTLCLLFGWNYQMFENPADWIMSTDTRHGVSGLGIFSACFGLGLVRLLLTVLLTHPFYGRNVYSLHHLLNVCKLALLHFIRTHG